MGNPEKSLSDDLSNCLIDFKKKVTITSLLNDYGGTLEQISSDLKKFIESEVKKQFHKHYLIRGFTDDNGNQLITIVDEEGLEKIQKILKKPITLLFSVEEVADGKEISNDLVDDHTFQPIQNKWITLHNVRRAAAAAVEKVPEETKPVIKQEPVKKETKQKDFFTAKPTPAAAPQKKTPPPKKDETQKSGIKSMFQKQAAKPKPVESAAKKVKEASLGNGSNKTPVKKIKEEPVVQHSPNIFDESSSDEEETLNAMKKELGSDEEMSGQEPSTSNKRRRIVDSDDEEEMPEKKQEKLETSVVEDGVYYVYEDVTKTYEDEDGFMVTKKERVRKAVQAPPEKVAEKKKEKAEKAEKEKKKTPPKTAEKKKPAVSAKGKITSFFTKK
uniref:DNA polymerase delta subunit 3 n=1 Tax=Megaselia scalaris TaxID=36166 RepID=T1GTK5_MEGSC